MELGSRIVVVGTSGSGKSYVGERVAQLLNLKFLELDSFQWLPNWTVNDPEVFYREVAEAVVGEAWVIVGNYHHVRSLTWTRAHTLIWVDLSFAVTLTQLLARTFRRSLRREVLWAGNRESLYKAFCTKDSILLWMLQTYGPRKREYPALLAQPEYRHLQVIRLRSRGEVKRFLGALTPR